MKIIRPKLRNLRNDEFFQFMTRVCDLVKAATPAKLKIEALWASFAGLYAQLDEALKKIMKSAHTAEIVAADRQRDRVFRGLVDTAKGAIYHYDEAVSAAAVRIGIVLDTYGNVAAKAEDEETSAIYNLLKEIVTKHAADMELIKIEGWVTELDKRNRAVEKLMQVRFEETTERSSLSMRKVRLEIGEVWYALADRVDALEIVEGGTADSPWAPFIAEINAIVERTENIVAMRKGRAAAGKERDEEAAKAAADGYDPCEEDEK